jgi:hypothetical protein
MIDVHSHTWRAVEEWAKARIETCRGCLEEAKSVEDISRAQGEIRAYRNLLALAEPALIVTQSDDYV